MFWWWGKFLLPSAFYRCAVKRICNFCWISQINHHSDFFQTYNMNLAAGRFFDVDDSTYIWKSDNIKVLMNEKLAEELGFQSPEEAIDQLIDFQYATSRFKARIIGVIKNYHQRSPKEEYDPILYLYTLARPPKFYSMNVNMSQPSYTINQIEKLLRGLCYFRLQPQGGISSGHLPQMRNSQK